MDAKELYDAHLDYYKKIAYINSREQYERLYDRSINDVDAFWGEQAREYLSWMKPWDTVFEYDPKEISVKWFNGGKLNASYNCLDRHLDRYGNQVAYYWEGDSPDECKRITYGELYSEVNRMAAFLKSRGVKKGDRVIIYMPMIVELPVAMLACARIGAVHSVVFAGFSAEALSNRIQNCGADILITATSSMRGGKVVPLKNIVDKALKACPDIRLAIVYNRGDAGITLDGKTDIWWHDAISDPALPETVDPEPMDAEDPLFILYTSGSTGTPKGMVHTHGGYLLYAAMTTKLVFDLKDDDLFWCTADIGWITGHSYGVYGTLINRATNMLFEGIPSYPDFDRYWAIVEKYRITKFYTAPTVIRALSKEGVEHIKKHDISSLKLLGSVGEPLNPEAWRWYYRHVGRNWCPIIDTWWQTETGGHMLTPLPGVAPLKPGSCSFPFFGVDPVIVDETGDQAIFPEQEGALCIRRPWPGMARTVFGDHERFKETYFSQVPGMYFSGDGAKRDEDGYYWIIGRIDDVLNVSGHRLGTAEIESALVSHKDVAEAAVVGFPHDIKGQGIYAFVTLASGVRKSEDLKKDLKKLVRHEIGPIATPDVIQWADALPKTRSGKIMRRILQKIAAHKTDDLGDLSTIADPAVIDRLVADRSSC